MKENRAFTLVEMIMGLIITTLILVTVLVAFRFTSSRALDTESRSMVADLQWVREMAVSLHRNYIVSFDTNNDSYAIYNNSIASANLIKRQAFTVDLTSVTQSSVTFSPPWGAADNAVSINLTDAGKSRLVNITSETGYVSLS
jgi:Tfp pilus assembly protein FimT